MNILLAGQCGAHKVRKKEKNSGAHLGNGYPKLVFPGKETEKVVSKSQELAQ